MESSLRQTLCRVRITAFGVRKVFNRFDLATYVAPAVAVLHGSRQRLGQSLRLENSHLDRLASKRVSVTIRASAAAVRANPRNRQNNYLIRLGRLNTASRSASVLLIPANSLHFYTPSFPIFLINHHGNFSYRTIRLAPLQDLHPADAAGYNVRLTYPLIASLAGAWRPLDRSP